jgi:hypothetical protein
MMILGQRLQTTNVEPEVLEFMRISHDPAFGTFHRKAYCLLR